VEGRPRGSSVDDGGDAVREQVDGWQGESSSTRAHARMHAPHAGEEEEEPQQAADEPAQRRPGPAGVAVCFSYQD